MDLYFDFGAGCAKDGYIKVGSKTLYNDDCGYGILKPTVAVLRKNGEKELYRDFIHMDNNSFKVKLDNGTYKIKVATGDYQDEGDVVTAYTVNGERFGVWVSDSKVVERVYEVEVNTNEMLFEFGGKRPTVNAIEIVKKRDIKMSNVSTEVNTKEPSVTLSFDAVDGATGYNIVRHNIEICEDELCENTTDTVFKDNGVTLCKEYKYTVTALYANEIKSDDSVTVAVTVTDGKQLDGDVKNLKAVSEEKSVSLFWESTIDALHYNIYQKAPYGKYMLKGTTKECVFTDNDVDTNVEFTYAVEACTEHGFSEKYEVKSEVIAKQFKRKMETLDRALVAVPTENGVFLSWRIQAYEYKIGMNFVLFRNGEQITDVITDSTNYFDGDGKSGDVYTVKAVVDGKTEKDGYSTKVWDKEYLSIPLDKPDNFITPDDKVYEYTANDASVADLDGDGEYEIILRWDANGKDNAHKGYTGECLLDAYKLDGTKLWRINLGKNIRSGSHYTQFMVYDFNNDGKAELICKTADGTIDGLGNVIGNADADYRNSDGFILDGEEYLTLFSGGTGEALDTVLYDPPRGNVSEWGDSWGNRCDRYLACVAYLDGVNPSVVMCRGYYDHGRPTNLVAWDVVDNKLVKRWKFRADGEQNIEYTYQGNHNLGVGDVDGDGKDEIVYGSIGIDHNGEGMYSTLLKHGDCINVGKFLPDGDGLECFQIHEESSAEFGYEVHNPATGEVKWGNYTGRDTTRGLCAKIDPRYKGNQCWVMDDAIFTMDGEVINEKGPESINFAIWWDGDLIRELLDHEFDDDYGWGYPKIYKWDYENNKLVTILDPKGTLSNNWKKGTPCIQADILGDWREEVVWRNSDNTELRVYTTTDVTKHKFYTLMHDSVYRLSVAWQNTAYNQCTQTGFYIGPEMKEIPVPEHEYVRGEILPDFEE